MPAHRRIPLPRVIGLLLGTVLLAGACTNANGTEPRADDDLGFAGAVLAEPTTKPDFTLTDTDGLPYDFAAETEGRVTLLFFGYTNCPDICPVHLANLAEVLDRPEMPDQVTMVFVGIDSERDTPEAVRTYLDGFDPAFVGLVGTNEELAEAQRAAGVAVAAPDLEDEELFGHAGQVLAYGPDGKGYTVYPFGTRQSQWAQDLPLLAELTGQDDP